MMIIIFLKIIKRSMVRYLKKKFSNLYFPEIYQTEKKVLKDKIHLKETMNWMMIAQDVTSCNGVSAYFDTSNKKWGQTYCETTGYIIETFINYFHDTLNKEYLIRAKKMGDWEISVQCKDGSFGEKHRFGVIKKKIFNTGQIVIGLISLYKETREKKYLTSAVKAGEWLLSQQENDGSWINFTTQGPKTYHTRVAWPLILLQKETGDKRYLEAGLKNVDWALKQQKENFWFDNTSLSEENCPWTHLIAYTISGLIEIYLLQGKNNKRIFESFYGASNKLLEIYTKTYPNYLPCSFDENWQTKDNYSCLTGNAQLAIIWMQIYEITKERKFLDGSLKIIEQIKKTQILNTNKIEIKGGVFGSFPISGDYAPFKLINWASKFFVDALLLKKKYI